MERFQFFTAREPRAAAQHPAVEAGRVQFTHERFVPVRTERMPAGKAVTGDLLASDEKNVRWGGFAHGATLG